MELGTYTSWYAPSSNGDDDDVISIITTNIAKEIAADIGCMVDDDNVEPRVVHAECVAFYKELHAFIDDDTIIDKITKHLRKGRTIKFAYYEGGRGADVLYRIKRNRLMFWNDHWPQTYRPHWSHCDKNGWWFDKPTAVYVEHKKHVERVWVE